MAHREFTANDLAIDQGLGPGDGILEVVTHHYRLGDEAQIHGLAAHLQARSRPGLELLALATAEQAEGHLLVGGIGNGAGVIDHRGHGGAQRGHGVHRPQPGRLGAARGEKIDDRGEMRCTVAEGSMLHGHGIETADAGDGAGGPGHRTVARRSCEHFQAIVLLQKAAGGHAGLAVERDHLLLMLFGQLRALLIPQPA